MKRRKVESLDVPAVPLNFLLAHSDSALADYELKKLADVANIRDELLVLLDRYVEEMAQAGLVRWFRGQDREAIKHALENPDDVLARAREQVRDGQRSDEELIPRALLPPGSAHIAASLRYQAKNVARGLCAVCPKPLAHHSVRYCERHLALARGRYEPKGGKGGPPGSLEYLYEGTFESGHGKQPGTLAVLERQRAKMRRSTDAEWALWKRVAKQLGMSAVHVRNVALGQRRSLTVTAALAAESKRE
jgi:hypothetical protein